MSSGSPYSSIRSRGISKFQNASIAGTTAVVSCLQEMRVAFVPELTPFVIQAAVTRVWVRSPSGGRQLAHLQMARRLPPG